MTFRTTSLAALFAGAFGLLLAPAAMAEKKDGDAQQDALERQAKKAESTANTGTTTVTATTDATDAAEKDDFPLSGSLLVETAVGIGTFVGGDQGNTAWSTAIQPSLSYKLTDAMSLSATIVGTFYHINDFGTPLADGEFLLSDVYLQLSHSKIFKDEDIGFTLSGAFRVYGPTSESSQLQNRILTIRPSLKAAFKVGPVTFGWTLGLAKYFTTTTVPTLSCDSFRDGQCRTGRDAGPGPGGSFESERRGGAVLLPSSGVTSFYVLNALSVSWAIIEDLTLGVSATLYNQWGIKSFDKDALSAPGANEGRSQVDRLITGVSLDYQIIKQLAVGMSVSTDTIRPFGDQGDSFVTIFSNGSRAPDNITSLAFSITGSL